MCGKSRRTFLGLAEEAVLPERVFPSLGMLS